MHRFVLIRGNRYRAYFEASPISDIYQCEKCKTQVNTVWLQRHPEQACPMDEIKDLSLRSDRVCRRWSKRKDAGEGGPHGSCTKTGCQSITKRLGFDQPPKKER